MKKNKKKLAKRDKMLVFIVTFITLYTIASFVLQFATSVEISSTLTVSIFSFLTVEIWQLASITKIKSKNLNNNNDNESGDL